MNNKLKHILRERLERVSEEEQNVEIEDAFEKILTVLAKNLPDQLNQIAQSGGNADGKLDVDGEPQTQTEGKLNINEEYIDEVAGLFAINALINGPSIITLAGKITKSLGSIPKMNVQALKNAGDKLENVGGRLQGKYNDWIKTLIKKMRPDMDDEKAAKISSVIFMTVLATVGIATGLTVGFGAAGTALGVGKNAVAADRVRGAVAGVAKLDKSQVFDYSKKLIPAILGKMFG